MPVPAARPAIRAAAWLLTGAVAAVPLAVAVASPLQGYRDPAWVIGGLAGVVALALLFLQPVLIGNLAPGASRARTRRWHRWLGTVTVLAVLVHVGGLYVTSPEDISDALLLVSPTPFALYGVIGLAGVVVTALVAPFRLRLGTAVWRAVHTVLAAVIVVASVVHAVLIEGVMGEMSKWTLCAFVLAATAAAIIKLAAFRPRAVRSSAEVSRLHADRIEG